MPDACGGHLTTVSMDGHDRHEEEGTYIWENDLL